MSTVAFKGNVGKVHGLKYSNDGKPRFSFSAAEGHGRFDQNNQWQDTGTTWWAVTVFGKQAETLADTITEGAKLRVIVAGRAQTREYEHNGEKRQSLDVIADYVGIEPRADSNAQRTQPPPQQPADDPWGAATSGPPF
jgi:single-strand DNA-binding protein